jgi:hypothetical protein
MPSYNVSVRHALDRATARARVSDFLEAVQRDYAQHLRDVEGQWAGDTLSSSFVALSFPIRGTLVVEETQAVVSGSLPLAAALFRGQIERSIRDELTRLLA